MDTHDQTVPQQQSFRERMIDQAYKFIREKVPAHTRAEYESLLAINTDLALQLINKWRELESLKEAYEQLQDEVYKEMPTPPVTARAYVDYMPMSMEQRVTVNWDMDRYRWEQYVSPNSIFRGMPSHVIGGELAKACHDAFHRQYVPQLWEKTAAALGIITANVQEVRR